MFLQQRFECKKTATRGRPSYIAADGCCGGDGGLGAMATGCSSAARAVTAAVDNVNWCVGPVNLGRSRVREEHRCQHGLRKMRESARNDISRTHANFARAHKCEQNTIYDIHTRYHTL